MPLPRVSAEQICTGHGRISKKPCKQPAMPNGKCRLHGGKSLSGIASPSFKTGRYSKVIPVGLLDAYERARTDPNILSLHEEMAVVDARFSDLLASITRGDTIEVWSDLKDAWGALQKAQAQGDAEAMQSSLITMRDLILKGGAAIKTWEEIYDVADLRRRLADTERRRLEALQATLTAEQALSWAGLLIASVKRNVKDPAALRAISDDISTALRSRPELGAPQIETVEAAYEEGVDA